VEVCKPPFVVAKNTVNSIQSGLFFGYVGLVDGIVERMKKETRDDPLVVATGGLATLIANETQTINEVDPDLTLEGLRILYLRNKG
jgi:type III pantothenate kinase